MKWIEGFQQRAESDKFIFLFFGLVYFNNL
jgi:hypothetical protein